MLPNKRKEKLAQGTAERFWALSHRQERVVMKFIYKPEELTQSVYLKNLLQYVILPPGAYRVSRTYIIPRQSNADVNAY